MESSLNSSDTENCAYCNTLLHGHYCSNCGKPQEPVRINHRYIVNEIVSVLNFNRGIFFTIKELIIRPGKSVHDFIHYDRNRLVKPIVFLILTSLAYTLIQKIVGFNDGYIKYSSEDAAKTATNAIFSWIGRNYGYANLIMTIFITIWIKILFWKYKYNFYEIFILLCFVVGISMLVFTLFGTLEKLTNYQLAAIGVYLCIIYCGWAIGQFFDKRKWYNYLKGILSYILGLLTFVFLTTLIGTIIDKSAF